MIGTLTRTTLIVLASGASLLMAAGDSIGMAVAKGDFRVDHALVSRAATLFDGSSIETAIAPSQLQLTHGVVVRLAADARATVYQRKLILERGLGQMESAAGYEVEARSLHISSETSDTIARVSVSSGRQVQVQAARGAVRVTNSTGMLIAKLETGTSMTFEPQEAAAGTPTRASGCLVEKAGKLILAEQVTNVILELHGRGLDGQVGNRIQISGTPTNASPVVPGASQVIQVTDVTLVHKGGCAAIAKKVGGSVAAGAAAAGVGAGAAAGAGIGVGTIAVIGGVAAAATLTGLAVTGTLSNDSGQPPSASR